MTTTQTTPAPERRPKIALRKMLEDEKVQLNVMVPRSLTVGMKEIQDRIGIPIAVQVRKAVKLWIESQKEGR